MSLVRQIETREMPTGGLEVNVMGKTMVFPTITQTMMRRGIHRYDHGETIRKAFPDPEFSADEREFLMTGMTPEDWEKIVQRIEAAEAGERYYEEPEIDDDRA